MEGEGVLCVEGERGCGCCAWARVLCVVAVCAVVRASVVMMPGCVAVGDAASVAVVAGETETVWGECCEADTDTIK